MSFSALDMLCVYMHLLCIRVCTDICTCVQTFLSGCIWIRCDLQMETPLEPWNAYCFLRQTGHTYYNSHGGSKASRNREAQCVHKCYVFTCIFCAYVFAQMLAHVCRHACAYVFKVVIRTWKPHSNLEMQIFVYVKPVIRIITPMVVEKRAVIERHSHVRLIEAKDIIPNTQALGKVFGQKQCHPAPNHDLIFLESASCKNSETSCLESRRKFGGVKQLTKIR